MRGVEVSGQNDGHALGDVVVVVVGADGFAGAVSDDFFQADGHVVRYPCAAEKLADKGEAGTVGLGISAFEFADDDAPFFLDGFVGEGGTIRKVTHDAEGKVPGFVVQVGQVHHVDGLQESGVGVGVAAKAEAQLLHGRDEFAAFEGAAAVKDHVLAEV